MYMEGVNMNLRKLLALLMTLVMLIGMLPVAQAQVIWCPDLGLDHSWGPAEYDYGPCDWGMHYCTVCGTGDEVPPQHNWTTQITLQPGCDTTGYKEIICADCQSEQGNPEEIPALGHDWGSWDWAHGSAPACTEGGWQVRNCNRCGQMEDKWVEAGSHQWGSWSIVSAGDCQTPAQEQRSCSVCGATESRQGNYGDHQFSAWRPHSDPTCTEKGWEYKKCSICGAEEWKDIAPIDHVFGEWYVVAEPHVGIPGLEQRDCTYGCGTNEQREIPALEGESAAGLNLTLVLSSTPANGTHFVVGEEVIFTETWFNGTDKTLYPFSVSIWTCDAPSYGSMVDQIGSWFAEDGGGPVAPGASGSHTLTVTVTEADVARGAIYAMAEILSTVHNGPDLENVTTPFVTAPCGESEPLPTVVLEKQVMNAPANGEFFVPGEAIKFGFTLWVYGPGKTKASSDFIVKGAVIYDPLKEDQIVLADIEGTWNMGHAFLYTVTEEDARRGYVENTGYATWVYVENGQTGRVDSNTVTTPCGFDNSGDFGLVNGLTVTKKVTSTPANGSFYVPGETVTYEVYVKNNGEPLNMLCVSDWMRDGTFKYGTIETGEDVTYPISYTVIELDAISGSVSNISFAEAVAANGDPVLEYSNSVTVPCGFPAGSDIPFGTFADLAIIKQEESLPLNGSYYTLGEEIHYRITYTNAGELTMLDVEIFDLLDGVQAIASAEKLEPGESRTCYYIHVVTDADVAAGYVCNTATGTYMAYDYAGSATSNSVVSDTSEKENYWGESLPSWGTIGPGYIIPTLPPSPGFPTLPSWTPDSGFVSIPKIPVGEVVLPGYTGYPFTPSDGTVTDPSGTDAGVLDPGATMDPSMFGTIDTGALHAGTTSCMFTITGRDQVSASYETSFCPEHADTLSSVLMMKQMGATPEMEMQAAAYAVALWRTEVESLYQTLLNAADPTAKAILLTEYVCFLADLANYELMLKQLYSDQHALVARKVADMWQDKCATLCYEMHTAAAERTDSLLNVEAAAGGSADACACVTSAEENGRQLYTQTYCPTHGFPFAMIDLLLKGEDTAEVWTMVRQIWSVELTSAYNKVSTRLGESSGIATAEHAALMQWMIAREASLIALYPNNPEVVAQAMVKTIMDRVNDLCQVSH